MAEDPVRAWAAARLVVELTERALADGLEVAVARTTSALGLEPGAEPDLAELLDAAIASAERALAGRDRDVADVDELREQARLDDLTGALNRRAFFDRLKVELRRADRSGAPVTLVLCDLDRFKALNDTHGHPAGDAALRAFAELLGANLRSIDSVGRLGGDEFGLVLVGADARDADSILRRLVASLGARPSGVGDLGASYGTARRPSDGTTCEQLVAVADRRLYDAKRAGGAVADE
ncbi:MAG: GGDEF domain-containing protein [Acidimicrobiales bacterium]|nr:GGDEF domain-containing protein [Acidimicrobiales bacterium]